MWMMSDGITSCMLPIGRRASYFTHGVIESLLLMPIS